jgi:uncharacterized protein (TIGR02217 family)
MAFHHTRFPLEISLGSRGGPQWATDVVELVSGAEERNSRWAQSKRRFDAGFGVKSKKDLQAILAFFEERRGSFHGFLFRDPLDHSSGDGTPTNLDQQIGVGDGTTREFQLVKHYGASFDPYIRNISKPVAGTISVAIDGLDQTGFLLDETTGVLTLQTPPATDTLITAGFEFDVPVRFASDRMDVEVTSFDAAVAPSIKLVEIRA